MFHVLHRHLAPRHPPYALSSLTLRDAEISAFFFLKTSVAIRLLRCFVLSGQLGRPGGPPNLWLCSPPRRSNLFSMYAIGPGTPPGPKRPNAIMPLCFIQFQFLLQTPSPVVLLSCSGGDDGTRTRDPRLAKAVLSQLSYIPAPADVDEQWAFQDSNLRPFPYQRNALTN